MVHVHMDVRSDAVQGSSLRTEPVSHLLRSHAYRYESRKVSEVDGALSLKFEQLLN